jgi:hypothetical protein
VRWGLHVVFQRHHLHKDTEINISDTSLVTANELNAKKNFTWRPCYYSTSCRKKINLTKLAYFSMFYYHASFQDQRLNHSHPITSRACHAIITDCRKLKIMTQVFPPIA